MKILYETRTPNISNKEISSDKNSTKFCNFILPITKESKNIPDETKK